MSRQPLLDYNNPEINARQSIAPNASCDVDGEYADVRNLMHLARTQAARIAALEAQLAEARAASIEAKKLFYGGHINHAKDMIDDALSALEATPPAPKVTEAMRVRLWVTVRVEDTGDGLIINADDAKEYSLKPDAPYEGRFMPDGSYRIALTAAQESGQ